MKSLLLFLFSGISFLSAQTLTFSLASNSNNYSITCANSTVEITASSSFSSTVNYTWSGGSFTAPVMGNSVNISSPGSYSVLASSGTSTASQSFVVGTNTTIPLSTGSPSFLVTSTGPQIFTFTAISPTVNITHNIYAPFGGTFTANSNSIVYVAGGTGVYRYCMRNDENGCSTTCLPPPLPPGSPGTYTGLVENREESVHLFPNPSDGLYTLIAKFDGKSMVEVYTSIGVLVNKNETNEKGQLTLDIREKQSGIYLLRLTDNYGKVQYLKLIKE